uniref:Ubinuclein 2a n=1 Tax=Gadus morhua TaxID=8049 RepID=A0A8C4ZJ18_GADMO
MAEPRKVQFVTLSTFAAGLATDSRKRRLEDAADINFDGDGEVDATATGADGGSGRFGKTGNRDATEAKKITVRLDLSLSEPNDQSSVEFNYGELIKNLQVRLLPPTPVIDPNDPFNDDETDRLKMESMAKKFENKYGNTGKKRKDRMQDLIDIGFGYDETDPFIDNSEAYDELVPASLTTKLGGFYINTGTLQFRAASESEGEEGNKLNDGTEQEIQRRKKTAGDVAEESKPRKNRVPKQGVMALGLHRPEKKKRKKLMKDSLCLAAMIRRFNREKDEMRKRNPSAHHTPPSAHPHPHLAAKPNHSLASAAAASANAAHLHGGLGAGLPAPLIKRIEDLRGASRQFDQEGRKKFFTLDMNNILLDIELQVQEQPPEVRSAIYSHMEAFVPCNKEALLKRLKKLTLNIQDDRLRTPLLKLKLAVCSVMPEQIARYNMDCMAKVAKQQSEEVERNGSEDEDEEKPGKRVMGPRKKFIWEDKLRNLLCSLVRVKLSCYELEKPSQLSVEDYLKAFMENEVKPLWPKGWMQARILLKESRTNPAFPMTSAPGASTSLTPPAGRRPPMPPSAEPICLSDSLDEDLSAPTLDSISHALALLGGASKGLLGPLQLPLHPQPSPSPPKQRPPPTSSPLLPPHQKGYSGPAGPLGGAQGMAKSGAKPPAVSSSSNGGSMGGGGGGMLPPPRSSPLPLPRPTLQSYCPAVSSASSAHPPSPSLSSHSALAKPHPHPHPHPHPQPHQSNFITPMQATLTKSSHSSTSSSIIKLTPRPPGPSPQHQFSQKAQGFRPPYCLPAGVQAKLGQASYSFAGAMTAGSIRPGNSPSPSSSSSSSSVSANHGQRQRTGGGAGQVTLSVPPTLPHSPFPQVSSVAGGGLVGSPPTLPLGYGMLGGLVPVSLPFQFPSLLNFSAPPAASSGRSWSYRAPKVDRN